MSRALIGHTGFVGGNLARQTTFEDVYNSKNIEAIRGRSYALVVVAGAPGTKWLANRDPAADRASLERLQGALDATTAEHVVLISTVDVYPRPAGVDEETEIDPEAATPYGRHRFALERFVAERFPHTILRLPGLFGPGLKKNVIYDLLNTNQLERVSPESVFQFYDLTRLWPDIERTRARGIPLLNVATEPTSVREVAREAFDLDFTNPAAPSPARYDFRSRHAAALGGRGGYLYAKTSVLAALRSFVESWRPDRP